MRVAGELQYLPRAQQRVAAESERVRAERDAFASFRNHVSELNPESATSMGQKQANGSVVLSRTHTSTQFRRVRQAYRETVMKVSHYSEDYDEAIAVNLANEFSEELSQAVVAGQHFTRRLKDALLAASEGASENRQRFLSTLSREASDLREAKMRLEQFEERRRKIVSEKRGESYTELVELWEELGSLGKMYDNFCSERQSRIQSRRNNTELSEDMPSLCGYLYDDLSVTHPVLAESIERLEYVRSDRQQTLWLLARLD